MGGVVFLSCSLFGMGCPALELAGRWVELGLSVEMEISGRALVDWYYVGPGGLWWSSVLKSALPPQWLRPDTRLEQQDPVSLTAHHNSTAEGKGFLSAPGCSAAGTCSDWLASHRRPEQSGQSHRASHVSLSDPPCSIDFGAVAPVLIMRL